MRTIIGTHYLFRRGAEYYLGGGAWGIRGRARQHTLEEARQARKASYLGPGSVRVKVTVYRVRRAKGELTPQQTVDRAIAEYIREWVRGVSEQEGPHFTGRVYVSALLESAEDLLPSEPDMYPDGTRSGSRCHLHNAAGNLRCALDAGHTRQCMFQAKFRDLPGADG